MRRLLRRALMSLPMSFGVVASCRQDAGSQATSKRLDSAGITIVDNARQLLQRTFALGSALAVYGEGQSPGARPLHSVTGAVRLANGVVAIADAGAYQLLLYRSDGTFWKTIGRKGDGPGEFQGLSWLGRGVKDSLIIHDNVRNSITVLNDTGGFTRSFQLEKHHGRFAARPVGVLTDGSIVMVVPSPPRGVGPSPLPVRFSTAVVRYSSDGRVVSQIVEQPGDEYFIQSVAAEFGGIAFWELAFGRRALAVALKDRIYVTDSGEAEIREFSPEGRLMAIVRYFYARVPLSRNTVEKYLEQKTSALTGPFRELAVRAIADMPLAAYVPAASAIIVDASGRLWLQETALSRDAPRHWRVFQQDGSYLGSLDLAPKSEAVAVEEGHILVMVPGENDEETIVLYSLPRELLPR